MITAFWNKAKENIPALFETFVKPKGYIKTIENSDVGFGIGTESVAAPAEELFTGDSFTLDFGDHYTGKLQFSISRVDRFLDAPVRLRFQFAEVPMELTKDASSYHGLLAASWLQDETVTYEGEGTFELPRRYSFRYCKITVVSTSQKIRLSDYLLKAYSAADYANLEPLTRVTDPALQEIDRISAKTLSECMQSVYEDGPKRDHRLWSGDMYLQALTDFYLFKNYALVRRCLYLFAACFEEGKYLPGCLFHEPELYFDQGMGIADYAFLFSATVCEYFEQTQDLQTAQELYPIVKSQMELTVANLDKNGIITLLEGWNGFVDWVPNIQRVTAIHGVFLFALEKCIALAVALGDQNTADRWLGVLENGRIAARKHLYDGEKEAFINDYDAFQYSVHAQAWMVLGGVLRNEEAQKVLRKAVTSKDSLKPVTPFMHHHLVEAMFQSGLGEEAVEYIKTYWGGMVKLGCDTFWEVYVPENLEVSPYKDKLINSFCHAWSCSPAYFIRKYLEPMT